MSSITRYESDFGGFSEAVVTAGPGRWIQVAGQVGLGPDGKLVQGGVARETHATFDHIDRILGRAGAELSHLVRITAFLTDLGEYASFAQAREERLGDHLPTSAAVEVSGLLLGAAVEIDGLAFVPE